MRPKPYLILPESKGMISLAVLLVGLAASHLIFEPAYTGYLISFAFFTIVMFPQILQPRQSRQGHSLLIFMWISVASVVAAVTLIQQPAARDVIRDTGAFLSFFVGFVIVPRAIGRDWAGKLLPALSAVGVVISIWTFGAAASALYDGVGAYRWRGEYVPFANAWLPYLLLADYMMMQDKTRPDRGSAIRMGLCVLAIVLSLSRTGLVLLTLFGTVLLLTRSRQWFSSRNGILRTIAAIVGLGFLGPRIVNLDVVQERIAAGVGDGDLSLGWRDMENTAAVNMLNDGGWYHWIFGYGVGARVPLPIGVLDFDGNPTIPHLHNSYYTLLVKFGVVGLIALFICLFLLFSRAWAKRYSIMSYHWSGGLWLLLFILGYAYTLQGLTQWSHLLFFGITSAMLLDMPNRGSAPQGLAGRQPAFRHPNRPTAPGTRTFRRLS